MCFTTTVIMTDAHGWELCTPNAILEARAAKHHSNYLFYYLLIYLFFIYSIYYLIIFLRRLGSGGLKAA
jgi:hypothetical protein